METILQSQGEKSPKQLKEKQGPCETIDYIRACEDGRFTVSASCVAISNPDLLPVGNKRQSWNKKLKKALT
jgi:hypothetical protein